MTLAEAVERPNCIGSVPTPTGTNVTFRLREGGTREYFFPGEWELGAMVEHAAEALPEVLPELL